MRSSGRRRDAGELVGRRRRTLRVGDFAHEAPVGIARSTGTRPGVAASSSGFARLRDGVDKPAAVHQRE